MADMANVLRTIQSIRQVINQSELEYAMMVELRYDDHHDQVESVKSGEWRLGFLEDEWPNARKTMKSEPLDLGPFLVGLFSDFPDLMSKVLAEIYMAANRPPIDDFKFQLYKSTRNGRTDDQ